MTLEEIFHQKYTENGDISFNAVSDDNNLLNILFLTEYYQNHLDEVVIGTSDKDKLFSMFIRDGRFGIGRRDLGRKLMKMSGCSIEQIVKAGRVDDLYTENSKTREYSMDKTVADWLYNEVLKGNELVKKWLPRSSSNKKRQAYLTLRKMWGMNKQEYGHFIKCNTVENKLSRKNYDDINFSHVPSLASIKYANTFKTNRNLSERYEKYLEDVKSGNEKLNISTTTVYDIYKNRNKIDADLFFDKIEKPRINCIPILDTSGSMWDLNDSIGKAISIAIALSNGSTYAPNKVISFSSDPTLLTLGKENLNLYGFEETDSTFEKYVKSCYTGDCTNTDFGKVMELLKSLTDLPEYIVVLSDMEFDRGSKQSKDELQKMWKENKYTTKIVWWNFNSRNITAPEMDKNGNIYMSGYNPLLLNYLQCNFDGNSFLNKLLEEYEKKIN